MMMPGKCTGPTYSSKKCWTMEKASPGGHDLVRRLDRTRGGPDLVQKMLRLCATKNGTEMDELLQAAAGRHKRARQDVEKYPDLRRRQGVPAKGANTVGLRGKEKDYWEGIQKTVK